jgi:uracil-DNA glycosylase
VKIVLVGEARGAREHLFEHGFVGSSGVELARMLAQAQIAPKPVDHPSELEMIRYWRVAREEHGIDIANVFNEHPPDNNIETFFTNAKEGVSSIPPLKPGKYVKHEMMPHVEALWDKLRFAQPNLVVALGNTACWAILGEAKISVIRGTVKTSPRLGFKVLPTYHPAAVVRQWNLRTIVVADFEKVKYEAEFNDIRRIERWLTIEPTLAEIAAWIERPAAYYAVDIENHYGPLSMVGFARSHDDALVIPFIDESKPGWNYWSSTEDEVQAWKLADKLLRKPVPKLFQNGIYDLTHLLRAGFRPTQCQDDSMLLHHSLYPEMLKGLGFLGSVYSHEIAWKQMRTKGNNLKRDE